jgi:hypothetical protein
MKCKVNINNIKTVNQINDYWSNNDYVNLLGEFGFPDADPNKIEEVKELLSLAMIDLDPSEAAEIVLTYKLSDRLNEGQIQAISHEMIEDKIAEEYPEPALHYDLFNINQLLYKGFNGSFPNTEATIITLEVECKQKKELSREDLIKLIAAGLKENHLIHRLFSNQIEGKEPFTDLDKIIWRIDKKDENHYEILTSKYWIENEDFNADEYEAEIHYFEEHA